ncbi:family 43 glycosylhydrolase [Streptomyces sp. NBC_01537]|uniref:family 43 glycosylhydrolase n=1 Tax=Streptomyces sp. NBC_01537 TaxID=2903896 RepID=UPI0038630C5A
MSRRTAPGTRGTQIGNALDRPSQLRLPPDSSSSGGLYAPTLRYHDGRFWLIVTNVSGDGNLLFTATDPAGPWSDPVRLPGVQGIDPDLAWDEEGNCWCTVAGVSQVRIDPHTGETFGEPRRLWSGAPGAKAPEAHGRVSIRMLRHYDAIGLLRPAHVDQSSGYRFYEAAQLSRLNRIVALKGLGFTLQQVQTILDKDISTEELRGMLRLRRAELEAALAEAAAGLAQVEARLRSIENEGSMPQDDVVIRQLPAVRLAELSATAKSFSPDETGPLIGRLFDELRRRLNSAGVAPTGPRTVYFETPDEGDYGIVVHVGLPVPAGVTEDADLQIVSLPPGGTRRHDRAPRHGARLSEHQPAARPLGRRARLPVRRACAGGHAQLLGESGRVGGRAAGTSRHDLTSAAATSPPSSWLPNPAQTAPGTPPQITYGHHMTGLRGGLATCSAL